MTQPGIAYPPQPGWWVRTAKIGVSVGTYKWAAAAPVGVETPVGHSSGTYAWSVLDTLGVRIPKYISGGSMQQSATSPNTWSEIIPTGTRLIIVWVADDCGSESGVGATVAGNAMTLTQDLRFYNAGTNLWYLRCFTMLLPASSPLVGASQTFSVTNSGTAEMRAATAYYRNVSTVGTPQTVTGGANFSLSQTVTSSDSSTLYAQAFSYADINADNISGYNQTQRSPSPMLTGISGALGPMVFGDAAGNGGTLTFSATRSDNTYPSGGIVIPLTPLVGGEIIAPAGIPSGEGFGTPTVKLATQIVLPSGIVSGEAFGTAAFTPGTVTILPTGIASGEAFGAATVKNLNQFVSPSGIASGEAFGTAVVATENDQNIAPTGIASAEAFGTATVTPGPVNIAPTGIGSAEAFGTATISVASVSPTFDAVGSPCIKTSGTNSASSLSGSGSHPATTGDVYAFIEGYNYYGSSGAVTLAVTCGGVSMTPIGSQLFDTGNIMVCQWFRLPAASVPSGALTINYSVSGGGGGWWSMLGNTISVTGVNTVGTPVTKTDGGTTKTALTSGTITSATGHLVIQAFISTTKDTGPAATISAYSQTQAYNIGNYLDSQSSDHFGFAMGYTQPSGNTSFSATAANASFYVSNAVDLS